MQGRCNFLPRPVLRLCKELPIWVARDLEDRRAS
jgi:hypothetical protein